MEAIRLGIVVKLLKKMNINNKKARLLQECFDNAPVAPIEQLQKEAIEFEKLVLERRASMK